MFQQCYVSMHVLILEIAFWNILDDYSINYRISFICEINVVRYSTSRNLEKCNMCIILQVLQDGKSNCDYELSNRKK